jgi:LuxR family maltose regulon positive regulatory protein
MGCTLSGDLDGIQRYGQTALETLPTQDALWRGLAAMALGDLHTFTGNMTASLKAKRQTVEACERSGNHYYAMISNNRLAATLKELGRLRETVQLGRRELDHAARHGLARAAMAGQLRGIIADATLELNDVEEARRLALEGLDVCRHGGSVTLLGVAYAYLIRVHLSLGDLEAADAALYEIRSHLSGTDAPPWATRNIAVLQTRLWITQGDIDRAAAWMDQTPVIDSPDPTDFLGFLDRVAAARVLLAQDRVDDSLKLLKRLHGFARGNELVSRDIEILGLTALAEERSGNLERAVATLGDSLVPAAEGGFVRTFVDEGPAMARLLYEMASRGISADYVRGLLSAFPSVETAAAVRPAIEEANVDLFEPLSDRELDVLRLIAEGLSNQEIGEKLFISLHTIKTHCRNLYAKLDTHSRTAAVKKARGLGLLPPV